jgi:NAD-dependent DNA ligase
MSDETNAQQRSATSAEAGVSVLRDIWSAQARSAEELESQFAPVKHCKAMRHIGNEPVDAEQRSAWRERLEREGKVRAGGQSIRDLVLGSGSELDATERTR